MNLNTTIDRTMSRENMRQNAALYWCAIRSDSFRGNWNARISAALWHLQWAIYWRNRSHGRLT